MTPGGIVVFVGPDRPRKLERVMALRHEIPVDLLDRHELDATQVSAAELSKLIRAHPAASPRRLIVIDEAHRLDASCLKALDDHAPLLEQMACVVLLVDVDLAPTHPLAARLSQWPVERFASSPSSAEESEGASARPEFAMLHAIARRDAVAAVAALHEALQRGSDVTELLRVLAWQLQRWLTVHASREAGLSHEQIAAQAGLRPWQMERTMREVAGRTSESLRRALERCWELEVAAKSGRGPVLRVGLESLLLELCRPSASGSTAARPVAA